MALNNLDTFLPLLSTPDTKKKLQIGSDLLNYLSIEDNSLECENLSAFIDLIIHWLNNSNFKVAQNGLEVLAHFAVRLKEDLRPYTSSIIGPTIDRLGDSKACVREQAKILLNRLMTFVSSPQIILEKLMPAFTHKNWKAREEICLFLQQCLLRYGVVGSTNGQLYVSKFVSSLVTLVSDPNVQVRDTSMTTLVEIYKHVGDRLRNEILRKHANMQQHKLQTLIAKFDEIAQTGDATTVSSRINNANNKFVKNRSNHQASNHTNNNSNNEMPNDEIDFKKISSFKRATSAPPVKRNPFLNKLPPSNSSKSSGAADEEMFMNQFEDVPRVQIFSIKDLELELNKINMICSNPNSEWEKRIECLKKFRSLLIAGATDYDEFYQSLTSLQVPFQTSVKDLRSQVVREACISIAFLSQRIGNKCDRFAEALLPTLIDSIQNSAKIMSSSAVVAIRFVIQHTHASRLIPIITYNFSSKSKEIRKACCEFLDQLLHTWPAHTLEKHVGTLQETIKKGISDADPEARALARKAFWGFADKFKVESDYLLSSLDSNKQRMLQGEQMSNWSSTNSLNKAQNYSNRPLTTSRTNSIGTNGSIESISRQCGSLMKRSAIPVPSPKINSCSPRTPIKATSAIDIDAQRRARTKANINLNQTKMMLNSVNNSLNKRNGNPIYSGGSQTHERTPRRNRVSKSQPGSRSASPSNRINCYSTPASGSALSTSASKTKRTSLTNRDQSPIRSAAHRFERKLSSTGSATTGGRSKSYLTSSDLDLRNRILHQNDEQRIENAFAKHVTPRKKFFDDQSDESETSSICSDASFANYGVRPTEDISKILENLSSSHWSDRKDGLLGLNNFLRFTDERLNTFQLKRITDIFTRMLVDPHTKAFSLFLNTLNELIHIYKTELNSWLYILMTRLFLKVGSDTLGSIQTRILKTFESIRESFPIENQFNVIMRLLSDQTQTLNAKVKIAILQYLSKLIFLMDSSDFVFKRDNNHDIQTALIKIVSWTADIKSSDLRKISQDTIVDLYNLNSSEMTLYLNGLRKTYQDAAYQIIQHKQKSRLSQSPSTSSSLMQTPFIVKNISIVNRNFFDGNENLNSADIYDSLRKTSDEIQKYSFNIDPEAFSSSNTYELINKNDGLNDHDDSNSLRNDQYGVNTLSNASLDSGISQNLTMVHDVTLVGNRTYKMLQNDHSPKINGFDALSINRTLTPPLSNGHTNDNSLLMAFTSNSINLYDFVRYLSESNNQNGDINDGDEEDIDAKITKAYEMLLDKLGEEKECYKSQVQLLRSLGLILDRSKKNLFNNFAASTLKLLINLVCQNEAKDVIKAAEDTAIRAICNFDPIESYKILQPYLIHEESSFIIIAIKILTKIVEITDKQIVMNLLPEMMPFLVNAYDNKESAVRKTAVFCMVAIYNSVGDLMNSYLSSLNRSKMKLLKLYIDRSIQTSTSSLMTTSRTSTTTAASSTSSMID